MAFPNVHINKKRLLDRLNAMSQIGSTSDGGVCRLALSDEDRQARDLFASWCTQAGLRHRLDSLGNQFARSTDILPDTKPVLIGSHLDTQPSGGKFDGVLGVLAALEVAEVLSENRLTREYPVEIVSWTNEEGARFAPAMLASGVFAGVFDENFALSRADTEGKHFGNELDRIGYAGEMPARYAFRAENDRYRASLELHIEQGPLLESNQKTIGVVTGVQGIRWYDVELKGRETHAGPTPMAMRDDPVRILPDVLRRMYALADAFGDEARVTIGQLRALPGSRNTVPGKVSFSVDLRHPDANQLESMHRNLLQDAGELGLTVQNVWHAPPVRFNKDCINAVEESARQLGYEAMKLVSGAGHDSVYVSRVIPTSMIIIPCKDGISHHPAEFAEPDHIIAGAEVLLQSVMRLCTQPVLST